MVATIMVATMIYVDIVNRIPLTKKTINFENFFLYFCCFFDLCVIIYEIRYLALTVTKHIIICYFFILFIPIYFNQKLCVRILYGEK